MKNLMMKSGDGMVIRILDRADGRCLVVDCEKLTMPYWVEQDSLQGFRPYELQLDIRELTSQEKRTMQQRFTLICDILPVVGDKATRTQKIAEVAEENHVSKQTIRKYLCKYLAYQEIEALAPMSKAEEQSLTPDQKNFRWALNKYYYSRKQHTLKMTYNLMLKQKYCGVDGKLKKEHPSFYQFRYFHKKTRNLQNYYIKREGMKSYQRNHRPCLGEGVQEFAPCIGTGMLDATVCDIYLVNEEGKIVGRLILTACVDANTGMCCGYTLTWEGGTYSLRSLMLNVVSDKTDHCRKFGIEITPELWPCKDLPGKLVTDMGGEYTSGTFAQICELGVSLVNLQAYRPELKGPVEKFFDVVQNYYKPHLKGKGVIESDFQLTLTEFEKIILHCILFYNNGRVLESYPYTRAMLQAEIPPYANQIWNWQVQHSYYNLVSVSR